MNKLRPVLKNTAVAVFWILLWQVLSMAVGMELLLPSPISVCRTLAQQLVKPLFWQAALFSLLRIASGFAAGVVLGTVGAVLSCSFRIFRAVFSPVLHIIRAAPVASFIILALVWIKSGILPGFISFLMVLPIVWGSVQSGIETIDPQLLEMASVFQLSASRILFEIKIPSIFPAFISSCTIALGLAWKSGVAAEVICRPASSIGGMLQNAKLYLETPEVFALTAAVILLSLLLELVLKLITGRTLRDKY